MEGSRTSWLRRSQRPDLASGRDGNHRSSENLQPDQDAPDEPGAAGRMILPPHAGGRSAAAEGGHYPSRALLGDHAARCLVRVELVLLGERVVVGRAVV